MAAGSSSQQNFRKAISAIKDSTSVGLAKVNSEYKDLNVSILKATNHVEVLPKEKHVRIILGAVSGSRPRADVSFCIHALTKRLAKTRSWVVALKTLIVIHRALREVDHSFCEELTLHNKGRGHLLNLLQFKDDSSPSAWDYSTWIRSYALYIEECLQCFRVLKYDFHRDHSRTKKLDTPALLEQLPALQSLLFRLLGCEPLGAARYNFMVQFALSIVAAESVRLYVAITDGILMLVDKFFEMPRREAVKALEIYRKSTEQAQRLSEFFEMCRSLEFGRRQKYVKIEQAPASFLQALEEYIKDAPQTLTLPWRSDDETPKIAAAPEANLETDSNQATTEEKSEPSDECTETKKNDKDAPPLIPDLLSWDEPSEAAPESDEKSSLPLSLLTPECVSDPTTNSELSSHEPASWELALVATPNSCAASVAQNKILDRSTLDSLYDAALTQPDTNGPYQIDAALPNTNGPYQPANVSTNPFETDAYYDQQMFYDPIPAAYPENYMQFAEIPQQQAPFVQQPGQQQQMQPIIGYDYMQMVGAPHQQQELSLVAYDYNNNNQQQGSPLVGAPHQQQELSLVAYDYNKNQQQGPPLVGAPHQQQELSLVAYDFNNNQQQGPSFVGEDRNEQQQLSFVGDDFDLMQMTDMPQLEVSAQQQEKPMVGVVDSTSTSRNPFAEPTLPVAPQSQSSDFSLI